MMTSKSFRRFARYALLGAGWLFTSPFVPVHAAAQQTQSPPQSEDAPDEPDENQLLIRTDSDLPETYPYEPYHAWLRADGGVPLLRWRIESGELPPGVQLDDNGMMHGAAQRAGDFQFTASVTDAGKPQQSVQKRFRIHVRAAFSLNWKTPAHVNGNRIEGSVTVSNTSPDDMDLTFDVKAVAENGRATEIGYQHFRLRRGTVDKELPFGDTLPHGGYLVDVNAVGEAPRRKLIYRERLQTPGPLQVTIGP
ncbi:MAG TPA: hypothetical protein VMR80_08390 [Candidatus Acidoferrum sp.]|nr:hypothetical protein [Candidatus Acidoferrum sp.]